MATLEEFNLAMQAAGQIVRLRNNMRQNANAAKEDLVRGIKTPLRIADEQNSNADHYIRIIGLLKRVADDPVIRAKLITGLTHFGVDVIELRNDVTNFLLAAQTLRAAPKTDDVEIIASSDALLASVSGFDTVWE